MLPSAMPNLAALAAGCALFLPSPHGGNPTATGTPGPVPETKLLVSEVGAGPQMSYVELFNATPDAVQLAEVEIETSQGLFSLADCTVPLPPNGYFVLTACRPEEKVATNDPAWLLKAVAQQVVGAIGDTVVVRHRGEIADAVCYGLAPDPSPRYAAALQAGQFQDGQFVDVSSEFDGLAIGRNASASDTDDLGADWTTHGGADARCGSPLTANTAVMGGEDFAIKAFQSRFAQIVANSYYRMSVVQAGYSGYTGSDTNSSATHDFVVDSPDFGLGIALSGTVSYQLVLHPGGGYEMRMNGTLSSPASGLSLTVACTQTWAGTALTSSVNASLVAEATGDVLPYDETVTLSFGGVRGAYSIAQHRTVTDLDGVARNTSATQSVLWLVIAGQVQSVKTSLDMARDHPATCWPYAWNVPNKPFTVETLRFDLALGHNATGDGWVGAFSKYTADYGEGWGMATYDNASLAFRYQPGSASFAYDAAATITYPSPGGTVTNANESSVVATPLGSNLVTLSGTLRDGSLQLATFQLAVDPPAMQGGWLSAIGNAIGTAAKWVGHVGATVVTGGACAVATTVTAAAAGITTVKSLGTTTKLGVAGTVAVGGGCVYVANLVYESTKPN